MLLAITYKPCSLQALKNQWFVFSSSKVQFAHVKSSENGSICVFCLMTHLVTEDVKCIFEAFSKVVLDTDLKQASGGRRNTRVV